MSGLNDFDENILANFISNIKLYNREQHRTDNERLRLRKVIKADSKKLENKYGVNIILNQSTIDINNVFYKLVYGLDLHSQLVVQGLGAYIEHFRNITTDIADKVLRDEFGGVFLKESNYISLEFIKLDDVDLYLRCNSILEKEINNLKFTVYIIKSKILYIKVETIEIDKKGKKKNV